ncbi:MAG TPA: hypothetical protein VML55_13560, partial [Planctomycetaceae bacterium]|nr:hypothetical protein [Planctomycetaceae bacterium]
PPVVERDDVQINRERLEPSIGAGRGLAVGRRVVRRDSAPAPAPGLDVQSAIRESGPLRTNWFHLAGQVLAYMGALVLTLGMALVLVGCFGGPPKVHFTPTGWLIATFGQLLLISGVITLVSSGMERTAQEVSWRLEALGEKLLRIEQAAGPTFPPPPIGSATRQAPPRRHPVRSTAGPV